MMEKLHTAYTSTENQRASMAHTIRKTYCQVLWKNHTRNTHTENRLG
nr:MAG TPA: hypothetical protein [Caudoviricetes sp.]